MIKSVVVAHSLSPQNHGLITVLATFPRIILAEVNTHRMLGKNTSSSRAIPFFKMLQTLYDMPFIPIAWQTHHKGMQGSEYIPMDTIITVPQYSGDFINIIRKQAEEDKFVITPEFEEVLHSLANSFINMFGEEQSFTITELWLKTRDLVATCATMLYSMGKVTKQICNRLLEPFMWTTMLITGNELEGGWDNFFNLRCPSYEWEYDKTIAKGKSIKELTENMSKEATKYQDFGREDECDIIKEMSFVDMLLTGRNKGQAEIHMMALAEAIYDSINESKPKQLRAGEWHIPFGDKIDITELLFPNIHLDVIDVAIKVSTAMGARTSYTIIGEEKALNYTDLINLDDRLLIQTPPHSSPMEHCARAMSGEEYFNNIKGTRIQRGDNLLVSPESAGWCRNYRGFIQRRHLVETNK